MKRDIIDRIEDLKLSTINNMNAIQYDCSPRVIDSELVKQYSYFFDGYEYYIYEELVVLFSTNDIPYTYSNDSNEIYIDSMINLVTKQKVFPFLLFLNGKLIPWSKINIVRNYTGSYIIVRDIVDIEFQNIHMFYFPTNQIRYGEDDDIESKYPGMYFDELGNKTHDVENVSMRIEIYDPYIYMETFDLYQHNYIEIGCKNGQFLNSFQMLGFVDYMQNNAPVREVLLDDVYTGASSIYLLSSAGSSESLFRYEVIVFYYKPGMVNPTYLVTKDFDKEKIRNIIKDTADDSSKEDWLLDNYGLFDKFDFNYLRERTYDRNTIEAARYIVSYDYALFNKVFQDRSPIKSECYKGSEFKALMDYRGYVRYSRKRSNYIDDYVIVFVNGDIYNNYIDVTYTTNTIDIPIIDIDDDDDIEILFFMNVTNDILNITVEGNRKPVYITDKYNLDICDLFDTTADNPTYNVKADPNGRTQYLLDYTYTKNNDGDYLIAFKDHSHYNKQISVVPRNQFRYYRFLYQDGAYRILLPMSFNYCNNIDRYVIFVNHRKIDKSEFTITIMNSDRPFDQKWLYLPTFLLTEDIVEIFYVPIDLERRVVPETLVVDGVLRIENSFPNLYALSKNTVFLFINGKKVSPEWIDDISMNTMKINTKINNIKNIEILEYQFGDEELAEALVSNYVKYIIGATEESKPGVLLQIRAALDNGDRTEFYRLVTEIAELTGRSSDNWTSHVDHLFKSGNFDRIVKDYPHITNPDSDYKDDYEALHTVLYQIVLDFYINKQKVRTGSPFTYDFELDEFKLALDSETNELIIPLTASGIEDKLFQYVFTDDYIPTADVPSNVSINDEEVWFRVPHTVLGTIMNIPYTTSNGEVLEATVFEETIEDLDNNTSVLSRINGHKYKLTNGILNLRDASEYNTNKDLIIRIRPTAQEEKETLIMDITLPPNITEFKARIKNATSINTLPANRTLASFILLDSNITNSSSMFYDCIALEEITFSITTPILDCSNMFRNCRSLTKINSFDISKSKDLSCMFMGCESLQSIYDYITVDATNFQHMFDGCISLTKFPQLNMTRATDTSYMFNNCTSLKSIPRIVTTEVLDMSYMFNGCINIVSIPELNAWKCMKMENTFYNCNNLVDLGLFNLHADLSLESSLLISVDSIHCILSRALAPTGPNNTITFDYDIDTITKADYKYCTELGWIISPSPLIITPSDTIPNVADMRIGHIYAIYPKTAIIRLGRKPTNIRIHASSTLDTYDDDKLIDLNTVETPYDNVMIDFNVRSMKDISRLFKGTPVINCENIELEEITKDLSELFMECADLSRVKLYCASADKLISTFMGCSSLSSLELLDLSTLDDMSYMLSGCNSLRPLPLFDISNVTNMTGAFSNNTNIGNIPVYNTTSVVNMQEMFKGCTGFTGVINNGMIDTSNVINMNSMFENSIDTNLPNFNYDKVETMECMFKGSNIENVSLAVPSLKSMDSMFMNCASLNSVVFTEMANVINIDHAFDNCRNVTSIMGLNVVSIRKLKSRVILKSLNIIENAFDFCEKLTTLEILNLGVSIDLTGCIALSAGSIHTILENTVIVDPNDQCTVRFHNMLSALITYDDYWIMYNKGWIVLPEIAITWDAKLPPDNAIKSNEIWYTIDISKTKQIDPVFISVSETTGIINTMDISLYDDTYRPYYNGKYVSGQDLKYTGNKNKIIVKLSGASVSLFTPQEYTVDLKVSSRELSTFSVPTTVKTSLKSISIIDNNIKDIEMMFTQCRYLETIGTFNLARATSTKLMFSGCINLVSIPELNTMGVSDMSGMFSDCARIKTIPELNTQTVMDMSSMFSNCNSLQTIPLLDTHVVSDMDNMFKNCFALTEIPNINMDNVQKAVGMFSGCRSLIRIPDTINTSNVESLAYMFMGCATIETIPNITTDRVKDMRGMFKGCSSLINVPVLNTDLVTDIPYMFNGCVSLTMLPRFNIKRVTDASFAFDGCSSMNIINIRDIQTNIDISDTIITESELRNIINNITDSAQIATEITINHALFMTLSNSILRLIESKNIIVSGL